MKKIIFIAIIGCSFTFCTRSLDKDPIRKDLSVTSAVSVNCVVNDKPYAVIGNKVYHYNDPIYPCGVNAMHVFSPTGLKKMDDWNVDIVREFVGNVKSTPITGSPIKDPNSGSYLHPLQRIVDSNRVHGKVTILTAFGWDGPTTLFTGKSPAQTAWWNDFKIRLGQWATAFKDQPDVWIAVWNEPYKWDGTDGYTDSTWMSDMGELVNIVRNAGDSNIVVIPGAQAGQDESPLLNRGSDFIAAHTNILFDIHAYEKWLTISPASMGSKLQVLQQTGLPVIFGETAPINAGVLMNPQGFLDSAYSRHFGVFAWIWKTDGETDKDALLLSTGLPNDNNNNNWGSVFKAYLAKPRNP